MAKSSLTSTISASIGKNNQMYKLPDDSSIPESSAASSAEIEPTPNPHNSLEESSKPLSDIAPLSSVELLSAKDKLAILDSILCKNPSYGSQNMSTIAIRASYNQILQHLSSSCQVPQKVIVDNILSLFFSQNSSLSILEQIRNKVMSNTKLLIK